MVWVQVLPLPKGSDAGSFQAVHPGVRLDDTAQEPHIRGLAHKKILTTGRCYFYLI